MRKISANYVIPGNGSPLKNGILILNEKNQVTEISDNASGQELANLEFYNGVIVPGFVNTHCHLELSHLKGKIPLKTGLTQFIRDLLHLQSISQPEEIKQAIISTDKLMQMNGIQAVADISNEVITTDTKKKSKIQYYTLCEVYNKTGKTNKEILKSGLEHYKVFSKQKLSGAVTPHSFYALNKNLFNQVINLSENTNKTVSLHNQESMDEILLFSAKRGPLYELINDENNMDAIWSQSKKWPFQLLTGADGPVLLVHNTFTKVDDIEAACKYIKKPYWAFCPGSNLFIENKLPDITLFVNKQQKITLGTDSLASNHTLNILEEIKIILQHFPNLQFVEVLKWATLNGAEALQMTDKLGSIEIGKQPGLNLINKFDFTKFAPTKESKVKPIVPGYP